MIPPQLSLHAPLVMMAAFHLTGLLRIRNSLTMTLSSLLLLRPPPRRSLLEFQLLPPLLVILRLLSPSILLLVTSFITKVFTSVTNSTPILPTRVFQPHGLLSPSRLMGAWSFLIRVTLMRSSRSLP